MNRLNSACHVNCAFMRLFRGLWKSILPKNRVVLHFCDFLELSRSTVAADFTHRKRRVEKFDKALGMQLQVAEQRFYT